METQLCRTKDGAPLGTDGVGRVKAEVLAEMGRCRLRIENANPSDEGTYRCVATNDSGSASSKASIISDGEST